MNRDAAVAPALMYQVFMSIVFRLEVSNYDDPRVALATCIFQGVLEIALRLTALERDAWVNRVTSWQGCVAPFRRWFTASVVPDWRGQAVSVVSHSTSKSPQSSLVNLRRVEAPKRVAALNQRSAVVTQFRSRMIAVDMWGECAGIYISSVLLFLGQSNVLYYPFRPFRKHRELLDGGNYYGELAVYTVVQIAIEIVTDTACLVFERRRGLKTLTAWREFPKAALMPIIIYALIYATRIGQTRSFMGDTVDHCAHRDMCWCVDNGLQPGGVREAYCLLIYPNSSGIPIA